MQTALHPRLVLALAILAGASSCGGDDDPAWGEARGFMNGEPWEGRAFLSRKDSCSGLQVVVVGPFAADDGTDVRVRFHLPSATPAATPAATPVVDVRWVEDFTQVRCITCADTVFADILLSTSDVLSDSYAVTPIAGAAREFLLEDVSPGGDFAAGQFSLSARLWSDGEPPRPSPWRPDTLLLQDVSFEAPLR